MDIYIYIKHGGRKSVGQNRCAKLAAPSVQGLREEQDPVLFGRDSEASCTELRVMAFF